MITQDDPEARLRKSVQARLQPGAGTDIATTASPYETPPPPRTAPPVAGGGPGQTTAAPVNYAKAGDDPLQLPTAPVPSQNTTQPVGRDVGSYVVNPNAKPTGSPDKTWLDWIAKTYGNSASRGGGFADLPRGTTLEQVIGQFNAETGSQAKFLGGPSGDRVDFGSGAVDALTSGGQLWYDYGAGGPPGAGGAPGGGGGGMAGAAGLGGGAGSDFQGKVRAMLMDRMKKDTASVDQNDPYISEPMTAARLEAERGTQAERTAMAERLYASGDLGSNSLQQGIQQSAERNAVGLGSLKANLIAKEYASRRSDLNDAMQQALASGDAELARSMQMAIAQLDATVRREGYGIDMAKFQQLENDKTVAGAKP